MLEPEVFYLLLSAEGVASRPVRRRDARLRPDRGRAAHALRRLLRPGLRVLAPPGSAGGSRAALEVRARDVSFMVEHRQPVCKLAFERMAQEPDVLYGEPDRLQLPGPADHAEQALRRPSRPTGDDPSARPGGPSRTLWRRYASPHASSPWPAHAPGPVRRRAGRLREHRLDVRLQRRRARSGPGDREPADRRHRERREEDLLRTARGQRRRAPRRPQGCERRSKRSSPRSTTSKRTSRIGPDQRARRPRRPTRRGDPRRQEAASKPVVLVKERGGWRISGLQ